MISRVITQEPNGIYVQVGYSSGRFQIKIELGGNAMSINLSRMEYINLIGVLQEGKDLMSKEVH